MSKRVDRELERVNGNSILWVITTVFSVMLFITTVSDGFLHPEKCVTPEEAAAGGVVPLIVEAGQRNCG